MRVRRAAKQRKKERTVGAIDRLLPIRQRASIPGEAAKTNSRQVGCRAAICARAGSPQACVRHGSLSHFRFKGSDARSQIGKSSDQVLRNDYLIVETE